MKTHEGNPFKFELLNVLVLCRALLQFETTGLKLKALDYTDNVNDKKKLWSRGVRINQI